MDIKSILSNIFQFAKNNQFKVKLDDKLDLEPIREAIADRQSSDDLIKALLVTQNAMMVKDRVEEADKKIEITNKSFEKARKEINFTREEIEKLDAKVKELNNFKGEKGDSPSLQELREIIEPLILPPIKGDPGKDYVLTAKDKKEIAKSIKVPIVEKTVETIIEKQPIVTNEIKEVAVTESSEKIKEKLESLEGDGRLDAKAIKNLPKPSFGGGIKRIDGALDTRIISPANGQTLVWNSTRQVWENSSAGGSGTPAGSDTQVQFNDGGSFGGDAGLTYNKTTNALTVGDVLVDDEAYDATNWDGSLEVPTKNAVRDKFETLIAGGTGDIWVEKAGDTMTGILAISRAGYGLNLVNSSDTSSAQIAIFEGDRATMANNDEAYIDLRLSDNGGTQEAFARLTWVATDIANASEDGQFEIDVMIAGSLTQVAAFSGSGLNLAASDALSFGGVSILSDAAGTTTLQNVDALDSTTETTIESAIDTLSNLTSIQGRTVTLADAGANAVFGWDDVAGAYENLTAGEVRGAIGLATTDSPQFTGIELGHASDTTLSRSAAGTIAVEGVDVLTTSNTKTLTNKRVTKRTGTTTSHATPTINTDNVDMYLITAQAEDITSMTTNLSGTPTEGQTLWIAITGTAARAITWGTSFEASTVALPTTTVSTNRLDVGFVWNTVSSKWRCIASA